MQRDPFEDADAIEKFEGQLDVLTGAVQADRQAFAAASKAVAAANSELQVANGLVARSIKDSIPDSVEIKKCQDEVTTLEVQLGRLQKSLTVPYGDWLAVNLEVTELNIKLATISGRLRKELEHARRAVNLAAGASTDVFAASNSVSYTHLTLPTIYSV